MGEILLLKIIKKYIEKWKYKDFFGRHKPRIKFFIESGRSKKIRQRII